MTTALSFPIILYDFGDCTVFFLTKTIGKILGFLYRRKNVFRHNYII